MFGKKEEKISDEKKLSEEKSAQLDDKLSKNILVHKMPKNYKAGTFSYDDYFDKNSASGSSDKKAESKSEAHIKGKKTGIIIMAVGFVVILLLVYGVYAYLKNPASLNFFAAKPSATKVNTPIVPVTPVHAPVIPTTTTSTFVMVTTTEETTGTTTPASTTPEVITPTQVVDTDADGLSDAEETLLGTDANATDSDGDKYNDLTELIGGYNPAGNGKLVDNANIKKYTNATYKYSILYPKVWELDLVDKGSSVIFTAADQSFVQVVSQINENKSGIKKWYESEFNQVVAESQLVTYNGWSGIKSLDGLIVYLTDKNLKNIYIISYTPASDQVLSYLNIFEAMMRSFTIEK